MANWQAGREELKLSKRNSSPLRCRGQLPNPKQEELPMPSKTGRRNATLTSVERTLLKRMGEIATQMSELQEERSTLEAALKAIGVTTNGHASHAAEAVAGSTELSVPAPATNGQAPKPEGHPTELKEVDINDTTNNELIMAIMRSRPGVEMRAGEIMERMQALGWRSGSPRPQGTVAAALSQLVRQEELERPETGVFVYHP
jgi:hypothetical protein